MSDPNTNGGGNGAVSAATKRHGNGGPSFDFNTIYHELRLFDELLELSALGSAISDQEARLTMTAMLSPDDFMSPANATIWSAIQELAEAGAHIDSVMLKDHLARHGTLEGIVGGIDYLWTAMETAPIPEKGPVYAAKVRDLALKRRIVRALGTGLEDVRDLVNADSTAEELLGQIQERLFAVGRQSDSRGVSDLVSMADAANETYAEALELCSGDATKRSTLGLPTGLADLDKLIGGLAPGHLYVVAGRPSMGKSSLLLRILESVGEAQPTPSPAVLFSLEMSRRQATLSAICSRARTPAKLIYEGRADHTHLKCLAIAAGAVSDRPCWIDDSPDLSIAQLRSKARFAVFRHKARLVVVDYLQRIRCSGSRQESRQLEIAEVSSQLKSMAKELNVPVLVAAQLNRSCEQRDDKRPEMSDLRESGQIEADADVVMLLYREEYYFKDTEKKGVAELIVGKNRMGPTGTVELAWLAPYMRFESLAREASSPADSGPATGREYQP